MSDRLRVGVVGLGIGFQHIAAYRELADLYDVVAVCDSDGGKLSLAKTLFQTPHLTESFDDLLALDELDVVDI